jgi:hypothetical protein
MALGPPVEEKRAQYEYLTGGEAGSRSWSQLSGGVLENDSNRYQLDE